jgi:hypothetical protein
MPELEPDHPIVQARLQTIQAGARVFSQGLDALSMQRRVSRAALAGKSQAERLMAFAGAMDETPVVGEEEGQG